MYQKSQIKGFEIQYEKDGQWLTLAQDEKMGNWSKDISPVTAQKFRLVILDSYGFAGVREFQLFWVRWKSHAAQEALNDIGEAAAKYILTHRIKWN